MIELHPFTGTDIPILIGWVDSPEFMMQWSGPGGLSYPLTQEQLEEHLLLTREANRFLLPYKVVDTEAAQPIGYVELLNVDTEARSAAVGRALIGPRHLRGKGLGTRMMQALLRTAFEEVGLRSVRLIVFDFNQAALACYEKVGFKKDRYLSERVQVGEERWSLWAMSVSDEEWRSLHPGHCSR